MSLQILLVNVHSSRNAGDAALTDVAITQLRKQFAGCQITLAMDDPDSHTGFGKAIESFFSWTRKTRGWYLGNVLWLLPGTLFPILTWRLGGKACFILTPHAWRTLLAAYVQADMVVSKPGGFIYSSGRGISLIIALYHMILAQLADKPVYMFPQSIGPLKHHWEYKLLRQILKRVRIVMVREPISLQLLQSDDFNGMQAQLLPDMAFGFKQAPITDAQQWLQQHGLDSESYTPLLGMTTVNWQAQNPDFQFQERYEQACVAAARTFITQWQGKVLLFPQVWGPLESQDDRVAARRIAAHLNDLDSSVLFVEKPMPSELLKSVYGLMTIFIGTRMHSNIFALSLCVPVIAIGYQYKTRGIMQMAGLEDWVIDIQDVTPELLTEKLTALMIDRDQLQQHLEQVIPMIVEQSQRAGRLVAADFKALREKK